MPCVTLHCLVHLTPKHIQAERFPGLYAIKYSLPESHVHYSLVDMILWSSVPYAMWQLAYHFFITVRRRDKIAAGRPTSFTWLRKSYGQSWIGKLILNLPARLHEPAFMLVQYLYATGTMVACPIWFWYRWPSAGFLILLFSWSIYNGATYYIDVFGTRFQKELEQMKGDIAKWQTHQEVVSDNSDRSTETRTRKVDEPTSKISDSEEKDTGIEEDYAQGHFVETKTCGVVDEDDGGLRQRKG